MENHGITSDFVVEKPLPTEGTFSNIRELYSSPSGYNRLFLCDRMGKLHVLKALQTVYAGSSFHEQALRKEFNISYQLDHPHICHTVGWEHIEGLGHCLLMEYIDGITLKDFIEQGKLTRPLAEKFIRELCHALQYLHSKQIIHRDLKPTNILITHNGNNLKLIDFSLSDCDDYNILKMPAGTRYYLAPEILQADSHADQRADIYSMGILIGEMATILKDKQLAALSRKCTRRKPEHRPASADEVIATLEKPQRPIQKYAALSLVAALLAAGLYLLPHPDNSHDGMLSPVYGNSTRSELCRQILADAQIKLKQIQESDSYDQQHCQTDSAALMEKLQTALKSEYPLPSQQRSESFKKELENLKQEVKTLYATIHR